MNHFKAPSNCNTIYLNEICACILFAEVTGCQEDYCANGGSCDEKEGEFICNCTSMWSGQTCKQQCKAPSQLMSIVFLLAQVYFGKMCKTR